MQDYCVEKKNHNGQVNLQINMHLYNSKLN